MKVNPLTYTVAGTHQLLFDRPLASGLFMPSLTACWLVTGVAAALLFLAACRIAGRVTRGDLR
jgi:hypothetical protein